MKLIISILLFTTLLFSATDKQLTKELDNLTISQYKVLLKTFKKGNVFDYGYSLTAITWKESKFGKFKVNLCDPSFGCFHSLLSTTLTRNNMKDTAWNRSRLAERLIADYDFSFSQALAELKYWENYWTSKGVPKVWSHTIRSYNRGFNHILGEPYRKDIVQMIRVLRKYFKAHPEIVTRLQYVKI